VEAPDCHVLEIVWVVLMAQPALTPVVAEEVVETLEVVADDVVVGLAVVEEDEVVAVEEAVVVVEEAVVEEAVVAVVAELEKHTLLPLTVKRVGVG